MDKAIRDYAKITHMHTSHDLRHRKQLFNRQPLQLHSCYEVLALLLQPSKKQRHLVVVDHLCQARVKMLLEVVRPHNVLQQVRGVPRQDDVHVPYTRYAQTLFFDIKLFLNLDSRSYINTYQTSGATTRILTGCSLSHSRII